MDTVTKVIDYILWLPLLPMLCIAGAVGVYFGMGARAERKKAQDEYSAAEAELLKEHGALNKNDFSSMVDEAQSDWLSGETSQFRSGDSAFLSNLSVLNSPPIS